MGSQRVRRLRRLASGGPTGCCGGLAPGEPRRRLVHRCGELPGGEPRRGRADAPRWLRRFPAGPEFRRSPRPARTRQARVAELTRVGSQGAIGRSPQPEVPKRVGGADGATARGGVEDVSKHREGCREVFPPARHRFGKCTCAHIFSGERTFELQETAIFHNPLGDNCSLDLSERQPHDQPQPPQRRGVVNRLVDADQRYLTPFVRQRDPTHVWAAARP
jgi:hypothetical protein